MAKKSVATLQTGSKRLTKVIKMVKKGDAKSYSFVETITAPDGVNDWLSKHIVFWRSRKELKQGLRGHA